MFTIYSADVTGNPGNAPTLINTSSWMKVA